jgi:phosphoglycolate phosphatase-like HAD superfamily hydrolase
MSAIPHLARTNSLYVHSASDSLLVRTDLQTLGLLRQFQFVCGSNWQSVPKPDPQSFATVRELMALRGSDRGPTWYVGDSPTDYRIAQAAGFEFVAAAWTAESSQQFYEMGLPEERLMSDMNDLSGMIATLEASAPS